MGMTGMGMASPAMARQISIRALRYGRRHFGMLG